MRKRCALLAALCAVVLMGTLQPASADCKLRQHDRIVLYSGSDDPDVLVWDSRYRLRAYHAATFDEARELLRHARLVPPGTRALVETCVPDFIASPLYDHPADAIGILIVGGPSAGSRGWVIGTDVRENLASHAAHGP